MNKEYHYSSKLYTGDEKSLNAKTNFMEKQSKK